MTLDFIWTALPARVVFATGALLRVADEVDRLGVSRVLVIGGGAARSNALARLRDGLGARVAGEIADAAQHVPGQVAEAAVATAGRVRADVVVTLGGGSATGLGKVVALERDLPIIAIPTTYAGSEMTPIWGRTTDGVKQTGLDARVLPRTVIYDPELCLGMPPRLAAASGLNALAHCVEAFWSAGSNPVTSSLGDEGARLLLEGLPRVVADSRDLDAHASNLVGACLAGMCLAQAGTGIHHRTCHVLGGGWSLPHAETHAVVLPHAIALVAPRAPAAIRRLAGLLDSGSPPQALFDLTTRLGLPSSLEAIGMPEDALDNAAQRVMAASRDDPLVPDFEAVRAMLDDAFFGLVPRG
jgi:maleylacetate reductase